MTLSLFHTGV